MGLGDTLPLKMLDSFVQEGVFAGFCHSVEMKNELLSSTGTIKALYTCTDPLPPTLGQTTSTEMDGILKYVFSLIEKNVTLQAINHMKIRFY